MRLEGVAGSANTFWTIYLIDIDSWQNDGDKGNRLSA